MCRTCVYSTNPDSYETMQNTTYCTSMQMPDWNTLQFQRFIKEQEQQNQQLPALIPIKRFDQNISSLPDSPTSNNSVSPPPPTSFQEIPQLVFDDQSQENNVAEKHKNRRGRSKGVGPIKLPCSVCGDLAPDHMHYGGVACFSCRAFFRRSVDKAHTYICQEGKNCQIDVTTRRNCQYCRFKKCLDSGMKTNWVLSEDERRHRLLKKRENAAQRAREREEIQQVYIKPKDTTQIILEDNSKIDQLLEALQNSPKAAAIPTHVVMRLSELTYELTYQNEEIPKNETLSFEITIELYKTLYSRIVEFTGIINEFIQLTTSDRKILLSHNLESICVVRMASNFHHELGLDFEKIKLFFGPRPLKIEQIFNEPWAVDQNHVNLYSQTVYDLLNLPAFDEKSNVLFQMVILLNTIGLKKSQILEERAKINYLEEQYLTLLLKYLKSKLGNEKAFTALHRFLDFLPILRNLSDKIQSRR